MKRRDFLQRAATTAFAATHTASLAADESAAPSRVIDTHTHFYDPNRPQGVPWPPPNTDLHRTVLPPDWLAVAEPLGIRETVVVEASPWVEDNQWILDLAAQHRCIVGLVGNLDPRDDAFANHLRRFAKNPVFRGLRWRSNLVPLDRNADALLVAAKLLADLDLQLDLNGPCQTLPLANQLARAVPNLRIVINHVGGSGDPQAIHPEWHEYIRAIAQRPNVFMKVSGMAEQVRGKPGLAPTDTEYYRPVLDHLWAIFGEDRLIYGSNWPVSDRGVPYETLYKIVREYFGEKGPEATEKYFWKNSLAAYQWIQRD